MKNIIYTESTTDGRILLYYYDEFDNSSSLKSMEINLNENI